MGKAAEAAATVTVGWAMAAVQNMVAAMRDHAAMAVSAWRPGDR